MYVYAKYCPVAAATNIVGDFWTPLIVRELLFGTTHFNQLARNVPGISRTVLAGRLRALERSGIVECEPRMRGRATAYRLTPAGRGLEPIITALNAWGLQWGVPEPALEEVEPLVAICMLKSRVQVDALPHERVVIEAVMNGAPETRGWLVCENRQVSMCFDPPGFDIDLEVRGDPTTLYQVWLQHLTVAEAIRQRRITVVGRPALEAVFARWFDAPSAMPKTA